MRRLLYIITVFFLSFLFPAKAQQRLADSISNILKQDLPDSTRAFNLVYYAMYMEPVDLKKAHEIYQQAVDFSFEKKLFYYAGLALRYEGTPYHISGQSEKEHSNILRAIDFFKTNDHYRSKKELGHAYIDLGNYYKRLDAYDSAAINYIKGFGQLEAIDEPDMVTSYINTSTVYREMKLTDKQKEFLDKALTNARRLQKTQRLFQAYIYQINYWVETKDFPKAKKYLDSAHGHMGTYDFNTMTAYYKLAAITHQQIKNTDSAIYFYTMDYEFCKAYNSRWGMTEPLLQIGHIHYESRNYNLAEEYGRKGLAIAVQDSTLIHMAEGYGLLSNIFNARGISDSAYEYLKKHLDIKDTLLEQERRNFSLDLEKKYETEKKESQIKLQRATIEKKTTQSYFAIAGAIALSIISLLTYLIYRNKQKIQRQRITELETEKQLTATEAVLKGEEQERARLAKDLHDGLGGMLSGIKYSFQNMKENLILTPDNAQAFERSIDMLDSSIREMRRVAHNMMPEMLVKYGLDIALKEFCGEIDRSGVVQVNYQSIGMEKQFDQTIAVTVYRIVQELVSNSIKHAAARNLLVQAHVSEEEKILTITVEDDGTGFDTHSLQASKGMGWNSIRNRIEFLKGKIDLHSVPDSGTSVLIEINLA